ncbi:hypothetical protein EGT07_03350 [Herbaspirillum sp. HC18]|nr:hypothetical protein EGT07_03350 [Herbaspirillum sp. HC18]
MHDSPYSPIDNTILGNSASYERLCMITEVLGKFVSHAPRAVSLAQLEAYTGRSGRDLLKLCAMLVREQLLRLQPGQPQHWTLACEANRLTLEDAFRCVMAEQAARERRGKARFEPMVDDAPSRDVDLLVMQATMGINQSVSQHLRQFSLDRLKVTATGMLNARRAGPERWPYAQLSYS